MSDEVLLLQVSEGIATLTLNRPAKRNALNARLIEELKDALARTGSDPAVRVVALRGAGTDFCAGADLADLERIQSMSAEENLADARRLGALFVALRELPKPVVALVQGRALAGGCGLATACDVVLARSDAHLGYPEVHLGFVPAMVMAILRRKVGEARAFDMVARGNRITAEEARLLGLVTQVLAVATFEEDAARYLKELASRPPSALALTKGLLYELADLGFAAGIERGAQVNVEARMTDACRKGVKAFLERSGDAGTGGAARGGR